MFDKIAQMVQIRAYIGSLRDSASMHLTQDEVKQLSKSMTELDHLIVEALGSKQILKEIDNIKENIRNPQSVHRFASGGITYHNNPSMETPVYEQFVVSAQAEPIVINKNGVATPLQPKKNPEESKISSPSPKKKPLFKRVKE